VDHELAVPLVVGEAGAEVHRESHPAVHRLEVLVEAVEAEVPLPPLGLLLAGAADLAALDAVTARRLPDGPGAGRHVDREPVLDHGDVAAHHPEADLAHEALVVDLLRDAEADLAHKAPAVDLLQDAGADLAHEETADPLLAPPDGARDVAERAAHAHRAERRPVSEADRRAAVVPADNQSQESMADSLTIFLTAPPTPLSYLHARYSFLARLLDSNDADAVLSAAFIPTKSNTQSTPKNTS
jgi:hypothetical protein